MTALQIPADSPAQPGSVPSLRGRHLMSFAIATGLFAVLMRMTRIWDSSGPAIFPSGRYGLGFALVLAAAAWFISPRAERTRRLFIPSVEGWCGGLAWLYGTDWILNQYAIVSGWTVRGEILFLALVAAALFRAPRWPLAGLALTSAFLLIQFRRASHGALLISDDHGTFLFRLLLLEKNFPSIPFFYPLWNAGIDARDFFATGALNIYLIAIPFFRLFSLPTAYNALVAFVLFVLVPASAAFASWLDSRRASTAGIAGILSIASSLAWYGWALKFGTLGFVMSSLLLPLNLALCAKALDRTSELGRFERLLATVSLSLMLLWPLGGIMMLPAALLTVSSIRWLLPRYWLWFALVAAVVLPCMAMLWKASNVSSFLTTGTVGHSASAQIESSQESQQPSFRFRSSMLSPSKSMKAIREQASSANPVILVLAIPGLLLHRSLIRKLMISTSVWLFLLGGVAFTLKPQLELDRMLVALTLLSALPAARAVTYLTDRAVAGSSKLLHIAAAAVGGFVLVSPLTAANVVLNRSAERYHFASDIVGETSKAIVEHGGAGRTLFIGFILHELSGGHIAPLTEMTGKPIIAMSYAHNVWRYREVIPDSFRTRHDEGILEYLNLMNVTFIIAHEPKWKKYLSARPTLYREVWSHDSFKGFERLDAINSYFLEGSGRIDEQTDNHVTLTPESSTVTIKLNYFPFLEATGCSVEPFQAAPDVSFIRLTGCEPGIPVTIRAVSPLRRLMS